MIPSFLSGAATRVLRAAEPLGAAAKGAADDAAPVAARAANDSHANVRLALASLAVGGALGGLTLLVKHALQDGDGGGDGDRLWAPGPIGRPSDEPSGIRA